MRTIVISSAKGSPFHDGSFEGFGTSFCWWANRLGYSERLAKQAAELFYDKEKGIGLNIVRYNIGGGDNPAHCHIQRTDSEVPGYLYEHIRSDGKSYVYDWTADANQRRVLEEVAKVCGDEMIVEAFSNSPPYFMTVSGCSCGNVNAAEDNLRPDCYDWFAEYLAEVAKHFKEVWGISFQSIAPMNEPETNYWYAMSEKQEGCHFDAGRSQSAILIALREALTKRGLAHIQISASDETSIDQQIISLQALEEEALKAVSRIDVHSYMGQKRKELRNLVLEKGKNLWMSEVDGGDVAGENAGQMGAALWLAERIITDLNELRPSAWILWQVIDRHICEQGYNGKQDAGMADLEKGYWGLAVANHDTDEILLTKKYYAMGQFSKFIRPGYQLLAVDGNTVAAYTADKKSVVIVTVNLKALAEKISIDLTEVIEMNETVYSVQTIRTSGNLETGENMAVLPVKPLKGNVYETELPGNSITTFLIKA